MLATENDTPLLSVVTVTWNCAATLEKTLKSVAAVKNDKLEYLIIDGVSTDGTLELIERYRHVVDRVVSEPDDGIYCAMNKGVALARGRYILFINGDDELVADGFASAIKAMEIGKADIICAKTVVGKIDGPSEVLIAQPFRLLFFNTIPHPSSFVRTELMISKPFREDLRIASDYDFFLQAFLARKKFEILPVVTALHYRGGMSGNRELSFAEIQDIRRKRLGGTFPLIEACGNIYRVFRRLMGQAT
ncbi:glycosyltransferase family 2 protein [Thalassospira marina]|uniref:Glycosyltransferase 2-like domain-containing protein n=1 Tax=Thalassospira marina TaxID=2048283 RepID=A0ABN5FHI0_9PROT|nr:glycosyltransferase family 2 protein [Thalassospira marina]AUG54568.1 hypothetical protein CSC3H3_18970 [Thalassospira marina]